jgi:hypothetical protein
VADQRVTRQPSLGDDRNQWINLGGPGHMTGSHECNRPQEPGGPLHRPRAAYVGRAIAEPPTDQGSPRMMLTA